MRRLAVGRRDATMDRKSGAERRERRRKKIRKTDGDNDESRYANERGCELVDKRNGDNDYTKNKNNNNQE